MDHRYEYLRAVSLNTPYPQTVVLRRKRQLDGSLSTQIADGVVEGLVSPNSVMSRRRADKLGFILPDSGPERFAVIDVDCDYLTSITWVTVGFSICGFIALVYVLNKLDSKRFADEQRRDQTNCQVALQLAIARQELCRHQ